MIYANNPDDLTLSCCDCGFAFSFPKHEQQFFAERGWRDPIRCRDCRAAVRGRVREHQALEQGER